MTDQERYRCEACGKEFDSRRELERHVHRVGLVE
jgi:DNA-directed RNA polymerase subunit RPC12/RpoP